MIITILMLVFVLLPMLCIYVTHVARRAFDLGYRKALFDSSRHGEIYSER